MALTKPEIESQLLDGIQKLGIQASAQQIEKLVTYLELLNKWNKTFNLSGIKDPLQMVNLHLLDSLAVSPHLNGNTLLDVGSGAGLPGIPLAIINPDKHFVLLDSNGKKTRFLFQVKLALGLENVSIENKRVEHYQCDKQIDIVICRAFSSLTKLLTLCSKITDGEGVLLAMKGVYPEDEIAELPVGHRVSRAIELKVPGVEASRYLIEIPLQASD